jgi:hypothetical protein
LYNDTDDNTDINNGVNNDVNTNNINIEMSKAIETTELNKQYEINNLNCEEYFVFKKVILLDKVVYLNDYIANLEKNILSLFKYNLIYKNNEIIIYNIVDTEYYLLNLLIHINTLLEITKIEIISDFRLQFVKSNIYKKLILF